jgi:hypothetical protein
LLSPSSLSFTPRSSRRTAISSLAASPYILFFTGVALSFGYDESVLDLISVENRVKLLLVAVDP